MPVPAFVKRVVRTCLRIGKDDKVVIYAWRHMLDLAEAFSMECKRAGAHALVEFSSDTMWYKAVTTLPLDYLETPDPFDLALAGIATAIIFISGPENPEGQKRVQAERWSALSRSERPHYERILERKVRMTKIMLGYVTPQRAKTYGFNYQAWRKSVVESTDVEYHEMQKLGRKLASIIEKSREVEITDPDGTNLSFTLEDRKAHVYDGIVDDEDIEMGAIFAELPGGTVAVAPNEASADGVLTSNIPKPMVGRVIESISLGFKNGKVGSLVGGKNIEVTQSQWERATGDKDRIGLFALGLNPRAELGYIDNSIVLGTASIGIGEYKELGGKNESNWNLSVTLAKPTVKLDGRALIKQGKLMV
ncbi:MAG: aminopeptidase [Candidatus Bathyarchaeota archaeon]|nr:aminopeptidase [Candidatus Bathyarchaeota archaeon]